MANPTQAPQSPSGLLVPDFPGTGGPQEVFLHDGRQFGDAGDYARSMEERGFCLVSGVPTSLPMSAFSEHFTIKTHKNISQTFTFSGSSAVCGDLGCFTPGADGPAAVETSAAVEAIAQYQRETTTAVKAAFPRAELLMAYNQVVRTSRRDAGAMAAAIRAQTFMALQYPGALSTEKALLDGGDDAGFLDSLIAHHSGRVPYAVMPGASQELQARVREALPEEDFIAVMKSSLHGEQGQAFELKSRDDGNFEPPALGVHTDITENMGMRQLNTGTVAPEFFHTFKADKYVVYHVNLWRNINPKEDIRNYHLAVLDKSSVAKEDATTRDLKFDGYVLEQYSLCQSPAHRWVYYPGMRPDEILVFHQSKCLMERDETGSWVFSRTSDESPQSIFHTAVSDPGAPEGAERDSCENRFVVFVPIERAARSAL